MSPAAAKKRLNTPSSHAEMMDYLESIGVFQTSGFEKKVERALTRFNQLTQAGYDLTLADATAEMEALDAVHRFPTFFTLTGFEEITGMRFSSNGGTETYYQGMIKAEVGGKEFHEIDESEAGSVHAIRSAFRKMLRKNYDAAPIRLTGYHVDSFRGSDEENAEVPDNRDLIKNMDEEDRIDTASPTRVTVSFVTVANGRRVHYAVQDVQPGVMGASILAVSKGLQYGLYRQNIKPR